jgi:hypothetical protein
VVDQQAGPQPSGAARSDALTDEEWIESLGPRLPERERLAALLARMQAVKYAGARPTEWAVAETFREARETIQELQARGASSNGHARPAAPGARGEAST